MGRVHDRALLDALEAIPADCYSGTVWRTTWATRDPLAGNLSGGRWDPPGAFEVLYTSLEADGSLAEVYYHVSQAPVFSSAHVFLNRLSVNVERILRLTDDTVLGALGIEDPLANRLDQSQSQAIGAVAHFLEFQGLLVPSARWHCSNLVLFLDRLDLNDAVFFEDRKEVNWPAWKEQRSRP